MKIILGCDHAAFESKEFIKEKLSKDHEIIDVGTHSNESCDYPQFAKALAKEVITQKTMGILLCGSGVGVSIVANRFKGIRAALCRSKEEAMLTRQHNDSNVLCMGARISTDAEMLEMATSWLETEFAGGKHATRISMFSDLGESIDV